MDHSTTYQAGDRAKGTGSPYIIFADKAHEAFYYKTLGQMGVLACYHQALVYILEISEDTRNHFSENYDRKEGSIQTECLRSSWQTSGSLKAVRLAFNLYTDGAPSADECEDPDEQIAEDLSYAASDIFCCRYAVYFMQGVKLRYPEYFDI